MGTDLIITVTSNTSWGCTYHYEVEIACLTGAYTGVPTFPAPASGTASGYGSNYPSQTIDLSGYCPGDYKLRVREKYTGYGAAGPWSAWSADFNFTVPGPTLTVTADADPTSICFPGTSDLSATPSAACGAVTYSWDNGGGPGQFVTVSPTATTTYTVTATDATSCVTATASVTVTAAPTAVAGTASIAPLSICDGETTTLTLTGETGTIQWQSGPTAAGPWTDIPGATTSPYVVGPLGLGDDLFFQAVVTSCGDEISNVVTVTVNPNPVITAPADFEVCDGTVVTVSGTGAVSYTWTGGITDGVPFTPPVGVNTYTVTGTDINGCQGSDDMEITVNALPTIDAGPDQVMCDDGTLVTLSGSGGVSYTWPGAILDGVPFAPSVGATTYTVIGTDANGCQNTDDVTVTVNPNPIITAPDDFSICEGTIVTVTGAGAVSYTWTGGITDGVPFTPPVGVTSYTVTGTDANGCEGSDDMVITVTALPPIDAGADITVCDGELVTLSGSGGVSYTWPGGVTDGVPFTPGVGVTTYTMVGTDADGCQNTDDITVTVNPLPVIIAGPDQIACEGDAITLNGAGGVSYTWSGGVTDGVPFIPMVGTATYTVTGTDINGCQNVDNLDVTINPLDDASFTYPSGLTHCVTGPNPTTAISGIAGGTFSYATVSGGPTLDINPANGTINLATSDIGTYDITYSTAGGPLSLCPQTSTITLVITDSPIADFFIDDFCANVGDPVPTFAGGGSGGIFTSTPGLVIDPVTGEIDLDASTPGTYTVTNTIDVPGCALVTYDEDMTIFDVPTAVITGSTTICEGATLPDLSVDVIGGTGPFTVNYTLDGGFEPSLIIAAPPTTITEADLGLYELSNISDANGCFAMIDDESALIDEYPLPVMDVFPDQEVCEGDDLYMGSFSSSYPDDSYSWTNIGGDDLGFGMDGFGDIGTFTGLNESDGDMTTAIEVTPTSAEGCIGDPMLFNVIVHPLPMPFMIADKDLGCEPLLVNFTDISDDPTVVFCEWDFGDGSIANACGSVPHEFSEPGTYDVTLTLTTDFGCTDYFTEEDFITVTPLPEASFSFNPQIITIENTEVEFTNLSFNADYYEWNFGDGTPINGEVDPTHEFPEAPGEYLVGLTAYNNGGECSDYTEQLIVVQDIIIFYVPNVFTPDGDEYNEEWKPVFFSGYDIFDFHLTLFNRWGEVVFESFDASVGWDGTYSNQGLVEDGTYIWQVEFKETMSDKRHIHRGHVTMLR